MSEKWERVIAHVDMDAFFAAVEQLKNPELRGKPVIIGANPRGGKGRGVVSTASYEARPFGVHSAMPISRAYRLCPQGIFIKPNGRLYGQYSQRVFAILEQFTPMIQPVSVDEAFLDLTGTLHLYKSIEHLGNTIREEILRQTGLTGSVGIATTKSVAKIASDYQKPNGLTIVAPDTVTAFLDPLPVTRLWGVGKKSFASLQKMGIETVGQLRRFPLEVLEQRYGKMGAHLWRMARGIDERAVHDREAVKSVSHETTFWQDQFDRELIESTFLHLSEKVSSRLRKKNILGKTIRIKVRFEDFSTFSRHRTLDHYTNLTEEIYKVSCHLFHQFDGEEKPVRLIGVGVSHLSSGAGVQTSMWDMHDDRKKRMEEVMDELQEKFGDHALTHASTLTSKQKRKQKRDENQ